MPTELRIHEVKCLLELAIQRINIGWSHYQYAADRHLHDINSESPGVRYWSLQGSISDLNFTTYCLTVFRIRSKIGTISLEDWNQGHSRTKEACLDVLECCLRDIEKEIANATT